MARRNIQSLAHGLCAATLLFFGQLVIFGRGAVANKPDGPVCQIENGRGWPTVWNDLLLVESSVHVRKIGDLNVTEKKYLLSSHPIVVNKDYFLEGDTLRVAQYLCQVRDLSRFEAKGRTFAWRVEYSHLAAVFHNGLRNHLGASSSFYYVDVDGNSRFSLRTCGDGSPSIPSWLEKAAGGPRPGGPCPAMIGRVVNASGWDIPGDDFFEFDTRKTGTVCMDGISVTLGECPVAQGPLSFVEEMGLDNGVLRINEIPVRIRKYVEYAVDDTVFAIQIAYAPVSERPGDEGNATGRPEREVFFVKGQGEDRFDVRQGPGPLLRVPAWVKKKALEKRP